jgi:Cys-tRNA synthase (O-phospho-L-seryl-tRNA:Cys-tRNA synthase)
VANATTAINIVLRNLTFSPGDHILCFSTIYGACEKTIEYITETTPASSAKIPVTYPVEDDWVIDAFKAKVKEVEAKGGKVKIAVFDTIVSMPGVRVPYERLIATCKELGVLSCVDGAHGVGHLDLNLGELDPDFLVSNCHKYVFIPSPYSLNVVVTNHDTGGFILSVAQQSSMFRSATNPSSAALCLPPTASSHAIRLSAAHFPRTHSSVLVRRRGLPCSTL